MNLFPRIFTPRVRKSSSHEIDPEDVFLDSQNISNLNINQLEGQLEQLLSKKIFYISVLIVIFITGGFIYKLFNLQIVSGDYYSEKSNNNHLKRTPIFALRGTISDRNGELLAWNKIASSTDDIAKRIYINKKGFSHILGYISYPKKDDSGFFWQDEYLGKDGVEREYQDLLQGKKGERIVAVNALNEIETQNITINPVHGENLVLTIDKNVQEKLYENIESLARQASFVAGAGVILDIRNGDILAMTSFPEYDNDLMTNAESEKEKEQIKKYMTDKRFIFLNRAISGLFTPGSTIKPYIAIAALMEGVITPEKKLYSSGQLVIKNKYGGPDSVFKDWKAHGYVDMRKALAQSSDEYFYQIGGGYMDQSGLGIDKIFSYANLFGFGTTTGIDLPGESHGIVPSQEWKKKVFGEDWLLGNTYHTSIGQYGFQVTPIELARAVASIANGGYLVTPSLVHKENKIKRNLNLNEKDLDVIKEGMRQGVLSGTGNVLNISGIIVAAKSGTAELGSRKEFVNSWITGYFPYEDPKYAFVVIMEKGPRGNPTGAVFAMRETLEWMRDNTNYTK